MPTVKPYEENVYTNEYYLVQYVLRSVRIQKKYCYILLTESEYNILKENINNIDIQFLYSIHNSNYSLYEICSK